MIEGFCTETLILHRSGDPVLILNATLESQITLTPTFLHISSLHQGLIILVFPSS